MNIFVGNLPFAASRDDVKKLFEGFGDVACVAIVMRKSKKAPKSRGFGFVDMPGREEAQAAIAALNGREFMGRVLNVEPARPNSVLAPVQQEPKAEPQAAVKLRHNKLKYKERPAGYKGGRRTHSYLKRQALAGVQEDSLPRRRSQDNPMRWRKKKSQPKPWRKPKRGFKPWEKPAGEAKPWSKSSKRAPGRSTDGRAQ